MTTHQFEQLGPAAFQQFAAALLTAAFGPVLLPMGSGADGGRDLYTRDPIVWSGSKDDPGFTWTGYSVVQVKQKQMLTTPSQDATWLISEMRKELNLWEERTETRRPIPAQLLFVTNVPLSARPGSGGRDRVELEIAQYLAAKREEKSPMSALREVKVWDRYMLDALLRAHDSVRKSFVGFLTIGDILEDLSAVSSELRPEEVGPALRAQSRRALLDEQWIYFREAGGTERTPLADIMVDLPAIHRASGSRSTVVRAVLERGGMNLRTNAAYRPSARHLVIAGAPGNGKTTVSQFVAQAFRASFVAADSLTLQQEVVRQGMAEALERLGVDGPLNRRWPIRVQLANYVQDGRHLVRFLRSLADLVSSQSDAGTISATNMYVWLRAWPWLVIFDGLDEVANANTRSMLVAEIEQFASTVDELNADVLLVVTTRPSGYENELDPAHFERLDLDYLQLSEARSYGELVVTHRLHGDTGRAEQVVAALKTAAENPNLSLLMRTPLQVAILSFILEGGQPPSDRYGLFWEYYETVLKRERAKPTEFADVLKRHGGVVTRLHERVGFALQARSEQSEGSVASISRRSLDRILRNDLASRGFDLQGDDIELVDEINRAGAERLLLLGPQSDGDLGFDVRSIQELMAARWLTSGDDAQVDRALRVAAPSPHWRNTWLFAAGRIFNEDAQHRQDGLLELVRTLDRDEHSRLGLVSPIGPYLALEMTGEGLATNVPRIHLALLNESFLVLAHPYMADTQLAAAIWINEARDAQHRERLSVIKEALGSWVVRSELEAHTAHQVIRDIAVQVVDTPYLPRVKDLGSIRRPSGAEAPPPPPGNTLEDSARVAVEVSPDARTASLLGAAFSELRSVTTAGQTEVLPALDQALADPDAAYVIDTLLSELSLESREIVVRALRHVRAAQRRRPIGQELDASGLLRLTTADNM